MEPKEDYYITASRFVPYKKIPLIVEAFSKMPGRRLVVIGEGPDDERARKLAGPNVTFVGICDGGDGSADRPCAGLRICRGRGLRHRRA